MLNHCKPNPPWAQKKRFPHVYKPALVLITSFSSNPQRKHCSTRAEIMNAILTKDERKRTRSVPLSRGFGVREVGVLRGA